MALASRRTADVTFTSAGLGLRGTVVLPGEARDGTTWPAALILPGSGPIDRDGDHRRMPLGISRALAESLADHGIASLRYDKRGTGSSQGEWLRTGLLDNVDDARAALQLLAEQPGVDPQRIVVVGHSEGAILATYLGADPRVAGLVLLSGTATPGKELLAWQTRQLADSLPRPLRAVLRLLRIDIVKRQARNVAKLEASTADVIRLDGAKQNAKWHRELLAYDPAPHLSETTVPVLAITGAKDLQVRPADLERIVELVPGDVETELVPDLTHILRRDEQDASFARYKKLVKRPVDAEVLDRVAGWILRSTDPQRREQVRGAASP
ncbi:alpha/beta hydrolase [Ornithinimicrobium avium]|uniref:Alpha/beta fold hydrolase n=1 Tax=Ornithinimicrobium avium TaxID=2283195 RepID=A0A345NML3_9MICO|nr:alpha/beta fold hydrolase [Ornithinimicrobium avium]AXH96271.1 alpha/beta fold hydrolase [Ornithinimicrobium avium]